MSQRLVLSSAFIAMEALAIFVIAAVLGGTTDHAGLDFPAFLAAELGGFLLVKGLFQVDLHARILMVVGGVVTVVALISIVGLAIDPGAFPPGWAGVLRFISDPGVVEREMNGAEVYGVLLLVVAWARGMLIAQRRIERSMALRSFSAGVVVLVIGLLFGQGTSARGAVDGVSVPLVAAGLLTLTLIHLRDARPADTGLRGPWVSISVGTIGALVLGGGALGVLPLGPMGFLYDHVLNPILQLALFLVAWTLIIIAFPFAWVLSQILTRVLGHPQPPQQQQSQTDPGGQKVAVEHQGHPAALIVILAKLIVIVAVIALVSYIAYRLFRRLSRPPAENEDRESLRGEGSLRADLLALLRGLRPHRPAPHGPAKEPDLPVAVLEVRRLYLKSLKLAADRGTERGPAVTPTEFVPGLEGVLAAPAAFGLTRAFERARYGYIQPTAAEIAALRDSLDAGAESR